MEEGSLLHEVLQRKGRDGRTQGTLTVDVVPLVPLSSALVHLCQTSAGESDQDSHESSELQSLDRLCAELNTFVESSSSGYPWFLRRPRFATQHILSDGSTGRGSSAGPPIKVLRAIVEYGLQVTDEWMMVHLMVNFTASNPNLPLAVECWDDDDGQILLIEAAEALPDWVDSTDCRHRCWIHAGQVMLLSPTSVPDTSIESSIEKLRPAGAAPVWSDAERRVNQRVTDAIRSAIQTRLASVPHTHRALVYLPRPVVETLMKEYSHLMGEVVAAFAEHASSQSGPSLSGSTHNDIRQTQPTSLFWSTEWMWTTFAFGRTHYALLRQFSSPSWPDCDSIPSWFASSLSERLLEQVKQSPSQLRAALNNLETLPPHVKHGLCVGVRLIVGLQCLCAEPKVNGVMPNQEQDEWANLIAEIERWRSTDVDGTCGDALGVPPASDPDDEDWMNVTEEEMKRLTKGGSSTEPPPVSGVESIIGGVRNFLSGESDAFGIDTQAENGDPTKACDKELLPSILARLEVDPVVVLNLLHAALKAPTADDLVLPERPRENATAPDPFFSEQDYHDLMGKDSSDGDSDNSTTSSISDGEGVGSDDAFGEDAEMRKLMNAMDEELRRTMDVTDDDLQNVEDPETIESMHLLSNLLQSLESSSGPGDMGPLQTMLKEMGIQPHDL